MTDAEYNRRCAEDVMGWEECKWDGTWQDGGKVTHLTVEDDSFREKEYFDPANNHGHAMMVARALNSRGHLTMRTHNNYGVRLVLFTDSKPGSNVQPLTPHKGTADDFCSAARAAICAAEGWG